MLLFYSTASGGFFTNSIRLPKSSVLFYCISPSSSLAVMQRKNNKTMKCTLQSPLVFSPARHISPAQLCCRRRNAKVQNGGDAFTEGTELREKKVWVGGGGVDHNHVLRTMSKQGEKPTTTGLRDRLGSQ